jgi:GH3 auxin-responsive promoter
MRGRLNPVAANSLLFVSCLPDAVRWRLATRNVARAQERILTRIIGANVASAFGHDHGFSRVRTIADYRERVPIRSHAEMEPYIDRCAAGEAAVLTAERLGSFAVSSGSSAASKLIPYTPSLLGEFRRGIHPWLAGVFLEHPRLLAGFAYWQISPIGAPATRSSGGIPIGFGEDTEYFGRRRAGLVRDTLAVPETVSRHSRIEEFRFETLRHLLACRNLRFISVWNPSFLTLLLADLHNSAAALVDRIRSDGFTARASELEHNLAAYPSMDCADHRGRTLGEAIWPRLCLISCWADASAREAADRLRILFPHVAMQPKGLIATEGVMSFPWKAAGSALAITSHFFEFLDADSNNNRPQARLAHELETGRTYSVVLTTSGGLYRYRIGDLIEVTGWIGRCPLLTFRGKEEGVTDLAGEKLNTLHVASAGEQVFARYGFTPRFWMLAPERLGGAEPRYILYVQADCAPPDGLLAAFEAALQDNFHYAYARRLGQLGPLRLFAIDPGSQPEAEYLRFCHEHGQRLGNVKRQRLDRRDGWSNVFQPLAR